MLKFVIVLCLIYPIYSVEVCNRSNSQDITAFSSNITSKGVIDAARVKYSKNQYYTDDKTGTIRGCDFCLGKKSICMKKCCDFGYGYNPELKRCVKVTEEFDPPVWNEYRVMKGKSVLDMFKFVPGKQNCTSPEYRIQIGRVATSHLKWDGSLYVDMPNQIPPWTIYRPDQYCVDTFVFQDSSGAVTTRLDALICFAAEQEDHHYLQTSVCMLISCVFILATCAVYAFLPELRNLHGRVLMAYLLCLFVAFAMLATMQILILIDNIFAGTCLTMTFIIYFSLLSAFFWLNVMCFDIWWTFSGKRGLSLEKLSTRGRFFAYAAYAFSVPSILTILIASLEFSGLPPHPLLPMIRHNGCFLSGNGKLLYLYGPIVLLCCANLIFFVLTAVKIAQIKQQTSVLKSRESSTHDQHRNDKQRLLLYVKLFSVMGINWILEVIGSVYPQAQMIWRFTDAYNVLIGVIIFIIFVCKRKIFHLMKKRIKERFQRRTSDIGEIKKFEQMQQRRFKYGPRDSVETLRSTIYMDSDGSIKNDKISKL